MNMGWLATFVYTFPRITSVIVTAIVIAAIMAVTNLYSEQYSNVRAQCESVGGVLVHFEGLCIDSSAVLEFRQ